MLSAAIKRLRTLRRPFVHGLVLVGLVPKFLVPVGYMPAAIAAGGPLMLCDAFAPVASAVPMPAATASPARHFGATHADHDGDPIVEPTQPGAGTHAHHGTSTLSREGEDPTPGDSGHGNDDHHEWKRCSLGGLAALSAVTSDWQISLRNTAHERIAVAAATADTRAHRIVFRSRAPPHA